MSVKSKMTALADQVRALFGSTQAKSIDAMTTDLTAANAEIASQADLLGQALALLEGKAAGGGSGGSGGNANLDMGTFTVASSTYGPISISHNLGKVPDFFMILKEANAVEDQGKYAYCFYSYICIYQKLRGGSFYYSGNVFYSYPSSEQNFVISNMSIKEGSKNYISTDKELKAYSESDGCFKAGAVYHYVCGCLGGAE